MVAALAAGLAAEGFAAGFAAAEVLPPAAEESGDTPKFGAAAEKLLETFQGGADPEGRNAIDDLFGLSAASSGSDIAAAAGVLTMSFRLRLGIHYIKFDVSFCLRSELD